MGLAHGLGDFSITPKNNILSKCDNNHKLHVQFEMVPSWDKWNRGELMIIVTHSESF